MPGWRGLRAGAYPLELQPVCVIPETCEYEVCVCTG